MGDVYLDNNATTQVAPEVLDATLPFYTSLYHNASSSAGEVLGIRRSIDRARQAVARFLHVTESRCVVFTSGATEANNWVVTAATTQRLTPGHVIVSAVEHPSILEPVQQLQRTGWAVTLLRVDKHGVVDADHLSESMRPDTVLVSVMAANNETGVLQPIAHLADVAKSRNPKVLFHTDATQAIGRVLLDFAGAHALVDLASFSSHKMHGTKGCGALLIQDGIEVPAMLFGGGQEAGLRSGTLNTPGIIGFGVAAELAFAAFKNNNKVCRLRDDFEHRLCRRFPNVIIHGAAVDRLPNTSCFSLPGCETDTLVDALAVRGIYVGTGSACSSGSLTPSRTLLAMGVDYGLARSTIRVSLSRFTTAEDIGQLLDTLSMLVGQSDQPHFPKKA